MLVSKWNELYIIKCLNLFLKVWLNKIRVKTTNHTLMNNVQTKISFDDLSLNHRLDERQK